MAMQFAHPHILWLMLPAMLLLVWFMIWSWRKRQRLMTRFIQARLLPGLTVRLAPRREQARRFLLLTVVALLFLTLARPQWGYSWEEAHRRGLDIVVAVDTSRSMLAQDVLPNRLERAKLATLDLLRLAAADRLALVAFAGTAFLQCPLTLDDQAFRQSLAALDTRIIPQGGTAMAAAIRAALGAFKDEDNFKVLILISDGEDHDDQAATAAREAAERGLRIFTLGVGTPAGEVLRTVNEEGALEYIKDPQGNVVKSRLNETLLQQVATVGQGFYLPLAAPDSIDTLYEEGLAPLPKSEISSRLMRRYHERFYWPLGLALLLLALETVLPRAGRRRPETPTGRKSPLQTIAPILAGWAVWLLSPQASAASPGTALKAYNDGHYETALEAYEQLLEKKPRDPVLSYNLGTSAYQAGDFPRAAQAFTNALTAPDLTLQQKGFYNLGNTLFRLGESTTDFDGKSDLWIQATNSFNAALQLDPDDPDARNNLDYVRRRLEELQQQQQQQQPGDQGEQNHEQQDPSQDDSSQDQQQEQQQEGAQQQPQSSQNSGQDQDQEPQEQRDPTASANDGNTQEPSEASKPEPQSQPQPQDPAENEPPPTPSSDPNNPSGQPEAATPGQMTPEQARQLLDGQKDNERTMIFLPRRTNMVDPRILRDW